MEQTRTKVKFVTKGFSSGYALTLTDQDGVKVVYRVTQKVSDLGWVDLELGSSPGRWAGTMVTYCPSRMVEHLKSKST